MSSFPHQLSNAALHAMFADPRAWLEAQQLRATQQAEQDAQRLASERQRRRDALRHQVQALLDRRTPHACQYGLHWDVIRDRTPRATVSDQDLRQALIDCGLARVRRIVAGSRHAVWIESGTPPAWGKAP